MIKIIKGTEVDEHHEVMEQAWRLRHDVFVEEKEWKALSKIDKREIDEFDNDDALHMLAFQDDELVGYQRLLPTTKPYLLSSIYPQLCEVDMPASPRTWEWTRYAVKRQFRARGRILSPIANKLLSAIVEWGLKKQVNSVVIEMQPLWMLRLVQLHFRIVPLGICHKMDGEEVLAVQAHFDKRTLNRLCEVRGDNSRVVVA